MKNIITALCLTLFSYQAAVASVIAGINFQEIASDLGSFQGSFDSNATGVPGGAPVSPPSAT